jgi:predicted ATPase/class 3 adenylate cyclase
MAGVHGSGRILALAFTDVAGSTALWRGHGLKFAQVLADHDSLLRQEAAKFGGLEAKHTGDGFFFVFESVLAAVHWADAGMRALNDHEWPAEVAAIDIRVGIDVGEPVVVQHPSGAFDFFGTPVNRAARLLGQAEPGQVLLSEDARNVVVASGATDIFLADMATVELKGLGRCRVWEASLQPIERVPRIQLNSASVIPSLTTAVVGRDAEREQLLDLFQGEKRLITLTGLGGIGKTSLLQVLCHEVESKHQDLHVVWAGCAHATSAEEVWLILHDRLHLQGVQGSIAERVTERLRVGRRVVALDNLEQVEDINLMVAQLLGECPELRVVCTSRRPLAVRGEHVLAIGPLSRETGRLLLIERAHDAGAMLVSGDEGHLTEISDRLEGIPLAIEVVAPWLAEFRPRDVAIRLRNLAMAASQAPSSDRHDTLVSALDWSFQMLPATSRRLLAQLGAFAGPFELVDLEGVVGEEVLPDFAILRRHSLVALSSPGGSDAYRLLEVVRWFATELLERDHGLATRVRSRHAAWYAERARELLAWERTQRDGEAVARLEEIRPNVIAAESFARDNQDLGLFDQLAHAVAAHDRMIGRLTEARSRLEALGEDVAEEILVELACVNQRLGKHQEVVRQMKEGLAKGRYSGLCALQARSQLALALRSTGAFNEARETLKEALQILGPDRGSAAHANLLHNLALVEDDDPDGDQEKRDLSAKEAFELRLGLGDLRGQAESLTNLGSFRQDEGRYEEALGLFRKCLPVEVALRHRLGIARALYNIAETLARLGKNQELIPPARASLGLFLEIGSSLACYPEALLVQVAGEANPLSPFDTLEEYLRYAE